MTIHLPPHIERSIQAAVHSGHFASVDDAMTEAASLLLERLKQEQAQAAEQAAANEEPTPGPRKPIWERILERSAAIPDEEWDKLPTDLAEQHDHYIYGTPKRPPSHEADLRRYALLDRHHPPQRPMAPAAVQASRALAGCHLVTTEEVLDRSSSTAFPRLAACFGRKPSLCVRRISILIPRSRFIRSPTNVPFDGFALYQARPDKGYSLTDCISMEAMRPEGITEILTHDNHFTQEGFAILL